MEFEEYCRKGEKADQLYLAEDFENAEKEYREIIEDLEKSEEIDAFILSKTTLGLFLTYIKAGDPDNAIEIWTADPEKNMLGLGVHGLETDFQVSPHDAAVYLFASAFLHALRADTPEVIAEAISEHMERILDYAMEEEKELIHPQGVRGQYRQIHKGNGQPSPPRKHRLPGPLPMGDRLGIRRGLYRRNGTLHG